MRLLQLFERTIKLPDGLTEDILKMAIYALYHYNSNGSEKDVQHLHDIIEDITGMDFDFLKMEMENRFKKSMSAHGDYVGITTFNVEEIPYYHSSQLIKDRLDQGDENRVVKVFIMVRENDNSRFIPNDDPTVVVNIFELSTNVLHHFIDETPETYTKAKAAFKSLRKVIEHELQHMVQEIALPPEQSKIKPNYGNDLSDASQAHDDYYSSEAEIRPHLSNIEQKFRNFVEGDEWWGRFSKDQKKEFFKMFVGFDVPSLKVEIGTQTMDVNVPADHFFSALKRSTPRKHLKIVKDFYQSLSDLF